MCCFFITKDRDKMGGFEQPEMWKRSAGTKQGLSGKTAIEYPKK